MMEMEVESQSREGYSRINQRCELGQLHRADGSSAYAQGDTVVWSSVFGPGDLRATKQRPDKTQLDVHFKSKAIPSSGEQGRLGNVEILLRDAAAGSVLLTAFPRTQIVLTVQEMENAGSLGSAALNGACLALLDAGIPMKSVFCGVTVAVVKGEIRLGPNLQSEETASAVFTVAFRMGYREGDPEPPANEELKPELAGCQTQGIFDLDTFQLGVAMAHTAAVNTFKFYRSAIQQKYQQKN